VLGTASWARLSSQYKNWINWVAGRESFVSRTEELVEELIVELTRPKNSVAFIEKDGERHRFRGFISTGDGRQITLSSKMEQLIAAVASELRARDATLAHSHTDIEWNRLVRNAFGPALGSIDFDDDKAINAKTVVTSVEEQLTTTRPNRECEHGFGCTLFRTFDVGAFSIGPVTFEPRAAWLARKAQEGDVSRVTVRRVLASWSGAKLAKRKHGIDALRERDVLDAVGNCAYVCSVRTQGLSSEAGRLKAQKAAHMALASVALRWRTPSRALDGFRLLVDPGIRLQRSLVFITGVRTLAGSHLVGRPHGQSISAVDWLAEYDAYKDDYVVIGEAIAYFLSPTGTSTRPKFMNLLAQALLWFHEACREEVDLMAIVKFVATLDALASGGKSGGIKRLVNKQLGIQNDQLIRENGPTLKAAVDEIYGHGRSRTVHGVNDRLGHDWSSTRRLAEEFARLCLIGSVDWMVQNTTIDDPKALQV
jgi:hypothetical protein